MSEHDVDLGCTRKCYDILLSAKRSPPTSRVEVATLAARERRGFLGLKTRGKQRC
jgi:hypothetical protein